VQVEAAFRLLSDMESAIGDLYTEWAAAFDEDREAALLFKRMATEEAGHARLVEYQRRMIRKNPTLSSDVDMDLGVIAAALQEVRALRESSRPPAVADAVRIALRLETSVAESHYRNSVRKVHVEMEQLLSSLGGEDKAHFDRLKAFAKARGFDPEASADP
jgi:rubrerythrin